MIELRAERCYRILTGDRFFPSDWPALGNRGLRGRGGNAPAFAVLKTGRK